MKILKAYCVELQKALDIFAASQAFFSQPEPRKRFAFLCSDDRCREQSNAKIIGVNYDKLAEGDEIYRAKHFKHNHAGPEHIDDCEWVEREIALEETKGEAKAEDVDDESSVEKRKTGLKTTNAIQVFNPNQKQNVEFPQPNCGVGIGATNIARTRDERIRQYKREIVKGITETSVLERITDDYRSMSKEERQTEPLTIKGMGRETYYSFVVPIYACRNHKQTRIYHGGAWVKKYGKGFALWFYDKSLVAGKSQQVSLYLSPYIIEGAPKRLRCQLEEASKKGNYALCFFFGHMVQSQEHPDHLNAEIGTFGHIVVYPITSKKTFL